MENNNFYYILNAQKKELDLIQINNNVNRNAEIAEKYIPDIIELILNFKP
jgi:hypothetical protein